MRTFVETYTQDYPELVDLLAADEHAAAEQRALENGQVVDGFGGGLIFPTHLPMSTILQGLKSRKYLRGSIRCKRDNPNECYVVIHGSADGESRKAVTICGPQHINRAVDEDIVAVELVAPVKEFMVDSAATSATGSGVAMVHEGTADANLELVEGIEYSENEESIATVTNSGETAHATSKGALYGRVVGIIRRNWRQYAGSIDPDSINAFNASSSSGASSAAHPSNGISETTNSISGTTVGTPCSVQFVPVDKRIPRVWITTRRLDDLIGARLLVTLDCWPANSACPLGHYVSILGHEGDKDLETKVLLHEFGVSHEAFTPSVMACLPPAGWKITEELVKQRTDLRHIPVCSIDPPGCKDIDDALHCIRLPNGRLEAGVHIADVTHFVHPDTPLDKEAAHRSTSTYLVERRLDMLPGYLTTELCSLRSTEDHLAFSVIWEMDEDGTIYDVRFCKSCIRSVASLTYDEAQAMLDAPNSSPINESVNLLGKVARALRKKRIEMGALTLASPEVRFKLDSETHNPTDVTMYALKEANALVEEWMLLANITVSKQMLRHYPTLAILRRHQPPTREQFGPLLAAASAVGVHLDISSSKTLADTLDAAVREDDPYFNKLLRILSTRCMMPAQYLCSGEIPKEHWHHYGLAAPVYTHFTSPIRRYADILVHRLLAASIGVISLPPQNADRGKQQDTCSHMNRRHRAAQHVQRASVQLHTLVYFTARPSTEVAYVLSVTVEKFSVMVPRFGIEAAIEWELVREALGADRLDFDPVLHKMELFGQTKNEGTKKGNSGRRQENLLLSLQVFGKVTTCIKVRSPQSVGERKLIVSLVHDGRDLDLS